uniref:Uncharacterized protein n=1 Tax=Tanacetum cinerariifolium TaxID=118510 RepID=A0A699IG87_TANCI|nr:hypothetical protein [Tanacetum cinerariifolium]
MCARALAIILGLLKRINMNQEIVNVHARQARRMKFVLYLCHEVTEAVKEKVEVIEEVKELGVRAQGSDSMEYLRILHLCHEVTEAVKEKVEVIEEVKELGVRAQGSDSMEYIRILRDEGLAKANDIMNLIKETQKHTRGKYVYIAKVKLDRK